MQAKPFYLSAILAIGALYGCTGNSASSKQKGSDSSNAPVETKAPNSKYKPAFEGQTRIAGVKTTTPYKVDKIAEKLGNPWAVIPMGDGRLLISIKAGYMEIHDSTGALVKKITGFPAVDDAAQGGLLDVALDPAFNTNKTIYWSFSEKYGVGNLTAVAKGQLNEAAGTVDKPTVIFRATPALKSNLHFGSRLVFDKDGNLFVSAGERSILEGRAQAQLLQAGLGKVFKITTDGKAAPGNPFAGTQGAMPEIYALGIRNPQGLDINPVTGELWEVEFGPRGGDEVNIIRAGKNYGWPTITYGIEYSGEPVGKGIQQQDGLEQPVYYWDPVVSPSGISFYKGDAIPEWKNNLFISCLSSTHIARLVISNNKVVGEENLLADKGERFRDVAYVNGMLYTVTDGGNLYRISRK
ncbi:PQQ-dependent sugar dehydrogenase [Deminuibacter soli]|uniref:PQQ-dependent sugar dehydrogenase n=1 Tax=Deminuibacter soli TaxID=2291815 RepID=A0A3E1NMM5_9BACT|nr:PQQ-dependent sugar dehydrogenase [Deminuibacter soli]RFM29179.1 PQQ-dependent sugar dehydrogenase [Deminuibacter soli]